jgi:K+-sensing histidine kinase KdpD
MSGELHIPTQVDLSAFISQEAHDLKSPFNRALGFLKLVMKGMDGPITDQAKDDLTIAHQNILYTLAMMNSLVEMARLGRGERSPKLTPRPLAPIIQQVIVEWKRQYHKENTVEIIPQVPDVSVMADELMLRQGLGKWISYVNEFVQDAATIHVVAEDHASELLFTIRSEGTKAVPPPECDLTMHGFIARQILYLHGGELILLQEHEQGATVKFSLRKG